MNGPALLVCTSRFPVIEIGARQNESGSVSLQQINNNCTSTARYCSIIKTDAAPAVFKKPSTLTDQLAPNVST